jgi:pimeloyl-ACP methyl ester carboxylesterase
VSRRRLVVLGNVVVLAAAALAAAALGSGSRHASTALTAPPAATGASAVSPSAATAGPSATVAAGSGSGSGSAPHAAARPPAALPWRRCEGGSYECLSLPVPLDRAHPQAGTIRLALIRLPAANRASRIGTLVINPGGPGASGYDWVRDSAPSVMSAALRSHFDLLGFDPRGVGRSAAVDCESDAKLDELFHADPVPRTSRGRATYARESLALTRGCQQRSGRVLAHVGTAEAAADIESIRVALGEAKISYFGFSYGTYLGAQWLQQFPSTVRAAVLDGALDPSLDLVGFVAGQAKAFDAALVRFFDWCDRDASCAYHSGSPAAGRFDLLARAVAQRPLPAGGGRTLGTGELQYGVGYGMYSRYLWPRLAQSLQDATAGRGRGLLDMSDSYLSRGPDGSYDSSFESNLAVNCVDHAGPRNEQGWYDAARRAARTAPRLGFAIVYTSLACATWPVPARPAVRIDGAGAPPVVVVGGRHDPATPYSWAVALHKDLLRSRLITRDRDASGDGHTSYGGISPCTVRYVDAYLLKGALPPAGARC